LCLFLIFNQFMFVSVFLHTVSANVWRLAEVAVFVTDFFLLI
jgi:hypothetical protein